MKNVLLYSILIFTVPTVFMMVMKHATKHVMHPIKTIKRIFEIAIFCAVIFTIYYLYTRFGSNL